MKCEGETYYTKPYTIGAEEIITCSQIVDPHYDHMDGMKAKQGLFHSFIASGLYTMAISDGDCRRLGLLERIC